MKKLALLCIAASALSLPALGAADCKKHPKAEWMKEEDLKKKLEGEGYKIKKFKVDGNCYEIYGWDKDKRKVEIYFNPVDGKVVKQEIED